MHFSGPFHAFSKFHCEDVCFEIDSPTDGIGLTNYKASYQGSDFIRFDVFGNAVEDEKLLSSLAT